MRSVPWGRQVTRGRHQIFFKILLKCHVLKKENVGLHRAENGEINSVHGMRTDDPHVQGIVPGLGDMRTPSLLATALLCSRHTVLLAYFI